MVLKACSFLVLVYMRYFSLSEVGNSCSSRAGRLLVTAQHLAACWSTPTVCSTLLTSMYKILEIGFPISIFKRLTYSSALTKLLTTILLPLVPASDCLKLSVVNPGTWNWSSPRLNQLNTLWNRLSQRYRNKTLQKCHWLRCA